MTARWKAAAATAAVLLLASLVPGTQAAFTGASTIAGAVSAAALVDRLEVERPDPLVAQPAAVAGVRYVEQLRPRGGGLATGLPAAQVAEDGGASATVAETGSDRRRMPLNGGLDAGTSGWSATTTNALDGQADHVTTGGNPGGALRLRAAGRDTGPVSVTTTWSTSFDLISGSRAVSLRHDVRVAAAVGLSAGTVLEASLVDPGGTVTVLGRSPVAAGPAASGAGPWRTTAVTAPAALLSAAGTYVLRFSARLQLVQGSTAKVEVLVDGVELDVTGAMLGPVPANRTFDTTTDGWTSQITGAGSVAAFSPSDGEPVGSMRASITTGSTAATGTVTWSTTFQHEGGSAGRASLAFSHRILLGNDVTERTGYTVRLQSPSGVVTDVLPFRRLVPVAFPGLDPAWTRRSVDVPVSVLAETGTYHLRIFTEVYTTPLDQSGVLTKGVSIGYDNVSLERVATGRHLDVEAVVPATFRSTARLEYRAAVTGDPVLVSVWSGGTWRPLAPVASPLLTTGSTTLTHRADAAEAEVRIRFTTGVDGGTDDVLSLDYVRVVATDGPLRAGDTDLLLPAVATGTTAARLPAVVRLRNRGTTPLTLTLAADAPVLAWAGFDATSLSGGGTCAAEWTDGVALTTRCTLAPGATVAVDMRVVGGRAPGAWSAALVLSDADRPGYFRTVIPATVTVGA